MSFFDVYTLIMLFTFFTLLVSKSLLTSRQDQNVVALGKGKRGFSAFLEYFYYVGFIFLVYLVLISTLDWPFIFIGELFVLWEGLVFDVMGMMVQSVAIILFSFALASFKNSWRIGVDTQTHGTLITTGVFRYSRNPTYVAMCLLFVGFFISYSHFFFLGAMVFLPLSFYHQIRKEEVLLLQLYPEAYPKYQAQTRRILGRKR